MGGTVPGNEILMVINKAFTNIIYIDPEGSEDDYLYVLTCIGCC